MARSVCSNTVRRLPGKLLKGPVVDPLTPNGQRVIEFGQRMEDLVAEGREDLPLDDLDRRLDFRLVTRMIGARREDRRPVVRREVLIRRVQFGLVVARRPHGTP